MSRKTSSWSKDEVLLLLQLVKQRKSIIKGKVGPNLTIQRKWQAWKEVTKYINTAFPSVHRTKEQVEKKWQNTLFKGKQELAARNRQSTQTGKIYYFCKRNKYISIVISSPLPVLLLVFFLIFHTQTLILKTTINDLYNKANHT